MIQPGNVGDRIVREVVTAIPRAIHQRRGAGHYLHGRLPRRDAMCTHRVTDLIDQALQAERFGRFDEARGSLLQAVLVSQPPQAIDCRLRLAKLLISGGHAHDAEAEALLMTARLQAEQQGTPGRPPPPFTCWPSWNAAEAGSTGPCRCSTKVRPVSRPPPLTPPLAS